jgi:hypothetical protein
MLERTSDSPDTPLQRVVEASLDQRQDDHNLTDVSIATILGILGLTLQFVICWKFHDRIINRFPIFSTTFQRTI